MNDVQLELRLFERVSALRQKFINVSFQYSIFDKCYLRGCTFERCDFTGTQFLTSNLYGSVFIGCKFDYVFFDKTIIEHGLLLENCPSHENLRLKFARAVRVNFQQLGDAIGTNKAIQIELEATEEHLWGATRSPKAYYRDKYRGLDRWRVGAQWVSFKILDFVWGNGESGMKLTRTIAFILALIAFLDVTQFRDLSLVASYQGAALDSLGIFLGTKPSPFHPVISALVAAIRLVAFAMFTAITIRRLSRR